MKGYTDSPIALIEDDVLDIGVYVESLSDFILGCSTPMTIAIQGDWGSGKTSIMNMIRQHLGDEVVPVWFNTWQYAQFDMASYLSVSLVNNFLEKIGADKEARQFLRVVTSGALAFTQTAAMVAAERVGGSTLAAGLKNLSNKLSGNQPSEDQAKTLEDLREKIRKAVDAKLAASGKSRVVVFVDDLDRLSPEKAVELLETLKVFMDVQNCVFVLAVDYAIITQGLIKKFGADVGHNKGKSFFDKIIQLPFTVPTSQYNISAYVRNLLSHTGIDCSDDDAYAYQELVDASMGCNPRGMKRLFNAFVLLNSVATRKGLFSEIDEDEAQLQDMQRLLFATLCLQMTFQELYEFLIRHKQDINMDFLDGLRNPESLGNDEQFEEIRRLVVTDDEEETEALYAHLADFMNVLCHCLKADDEDDETDVTEEDIERLKSVLAFSAITANKSAEFTENESRDTTPKREKFRAYYEKLIEELKEQHGFTAKITTNPPVQPYLHINTGIKGVRYGLSFSSKVHGKVNFSIQLNRNKFENRYIFNILYQQKESIEKELGYSVNWNIEGYKKASDVSIYREGSIDASDAELNEIRQWHAENLINFKKVFMHRIKDAINKLPPGLKIVGHAKVHKAKRDFKNTFGVDIMIYDQQGNAASDDVNVASVRSKPPQSSEVNIADQMPVKQIKTIFSEINGINVDIMNADGSPAGDDETLDAVKRSYQQ